MIDHAFIAICLSLAAFCLDDAIRILLGKDTWLKLANERQQAMTEHLTNNRGDYLYEKDGSYNPRMVKKILKAAKAKPAAVFIGPAAGEDMMKWLEGDDK